MSIKYRPEIDGLRALAVISVILFHLNENWLPGGFLGVDIFFVLSGFLITHILLTEMQQNTFSFLHFYTRRIKRIYPAFIVSVALASCIGSLLFLYDDFNHLRKTVELSTLFSSNIYLGFQQGYFDLSANENPVLHIWSLAVEEQYYLFFPALVFFLYSKHKNIKLLKYTSTALFAVLLAASFLPDNFYADTLKQPNTYYLSILRFPELLVGSLLAMYTVSNQQSAISNQQSAISNQQSAISNQQNYRRIQSAHAHFMPDFSQ